MRGRRRRWMRTGGSLRRQAPVTIEGLERRYALDGTGPRPFIDLGPSDNVALDQPRVTVEFGDAAGRSIGPDIFNSWLLDTGANTILAFKTAIDDMNESPPPYQVEGLFNELGVGGSQLFDISAPYRLDFAGTSGIRQTISDTRIISDATRDVSMFGPFGIVGMPAMTGRVTTLDFTPWLSFAEGNFLMATDFAAELPAPAGPRYSISVDDRVAFTPDGEVIQGDHPPVWADIPFFTAEVHHGGRTVAGNFMFDTGAQVTIISSATAMALGLDSNGDGVLDETDTGYTRTETVGGVGGSRDAPVYMIDAVHLPTDQGVDLTWSDLQWLVVDIAPGIDGVFGFDTMTSGWIDATFSSGGAGYLLKSHLDFRGWDATGQGKIHFDINPDLVAVQNPSGAGGVITEPGGTTTVSESGIEDTYLFALRERPTADVFVDLVTKPLQLSAFPAADPGTTTLRFTPDSWAIPQTVVVRAVDDSVEQSLHRSTIRHVARSADPAYDGVGLPAVLVNIVDNDFPAIMILPSDGQTDVTEGGPADTYSLVLMRQPAADVVVSPIPAEGQVVAVNDLDGGGSIVFTPADWNRPQKVRVTAVDDARIEGAHLAVINHQVTTSDTAYTEAYVLPEIVFVTDNDAAVQNPPSVTAGAGLVSGALGAAITATGTWAATDAGTTVTLSASLGSVTRKDDGTWGWSWLPEVPLGRAPVTITATDNRGLTAQTSFTVTARGYPTDLAASPGDRLVTLTWTAPPATPGLPVLRSSIEQSVDDGLTWTALPGTDSPATSATLQGLVNGTAYRFRVAAHDADGMGPWSAPSGVVVPVAPPAAASGLAATAGNGQVRLAWSAPSDTGGLPIIDYSIETSVDGGIRWTPVADDVSPRTERTVTGLVNGKSYLFRVAAVNAVGAGASTASPPAIPALPAGLPTALKGTRGNASVSLAWKAPASNGGSPIVDYAIQSSSDGGRTWTTIERPASAATSATVTSLSNGTPYVFRLAAVNSTGPAAFTAKSAVIVPATTAAAPTIATATRRNGQVGLTWTAPASDGGQSIVNYVVHVSGDNGLTWATVPRKASAATAATVAGLTNGKPYLFRVAAVNSLGTGLFSEKTAPTIPATLPAAPTAVTAIRGDRQVTLSWKAPTRNGGAAIGGYVLQSSSDGGRTWTAIPGALSTTSTTVTGLTNGVSHVFRVAATNDVGIGAFSAKSPAATPATVPGAPTGLSVTQGSNRAALSWIAPPSNGGSAVLDHLIQWSVDGGETWNTFFHKATPRTSATITGLPSQGPLSFRVAAINAIGAGSFSSQWLAAS